MESIMSKLTPRQRDVVRLLALGNSQKEVANQLGLRYGYVRQVVMSARQRGQCRSTTEVVLRATQEH